MNVIEALEAGFRRNLPVLFQAEEAECALVCIAMIANYHGNGINVRSLRQLHPVSLKGSTLAQMMSIAESLNLQTRALRLELEQLRQLKVPCILHWNHRHFVVLESANKTHVVIHDPALGARRLSYPQVSESFTGVALEVVPRADFRTRARNESFRLSQLMGRVGKLKSTIGQMLLLSVALLLFALVGPFYLQWIVDQVLVSGDYDLLFVLSICFVVLLLLQVAVGVMRSWLLIFLSSNLSIQWITNVFAHLLRLPLDYFEKRHLGDIVSRLNSVYTIQRTISTSFVEVLIDGLMAVVTVGLMFFYSSTLAAITLIAVIAYFGVRAAVFNRVSQATDQQLASSAKQQTHLLQSIRGIQSIKVAGCEATRRASWLNLLVEATNFDQRIGHLGTVFTGSNQLFFGMERIAVIWIGSTLVLGNSMSVGMLMAYLAYKDQFATRIVGLIDKGMEFRMLRLHSERLADIVLTAPEREASNYSGVADLTSIAIEVRSLGFRYAEGEPWIIKDCSFEIREGDSVAIVGVSGCGKTTLVKLLLGLLKPTEGEITVGGRHLHQLLPYPFRSLTPAVRIVVASAD